MKQKKMPKLSIIIPAYNCENYIDRTMQSIIKQNFQDYEILVINDGSTDNTQEKIEYFSRKYDNVKIFLKPNGGVSDARNFGLEKAMGEYVIFIDSDDYILDGYFEYISSIIADNNIDCIIFNHLIGSKQKVIEQSKNYQITNDEIINQKEVISRFLLGHITNSPWDKVFKKSIVKNIYFPKGITVGEDALFSISFFLNSSKIKLSNKSYYVYMQDTHGVTKSAFSKKKLEDITWVMKTIEKKLQNQISEEKISFMIFNQMVAYIINSNIKILFNSSESSFFGKKISKLKIKDIKGFKKKVAFLGLSIFYKIIKRKTND